MYCVKIGTSYTYAYHRKQCVDSYLHEFWAQNERTIHLQIFQCQNSFDESFIFTVESLMYRDGLSYCVAWCPQLESVLTIIWYSRSMKGIQGSLGIQALHLDRLSHDIAYPSRKNFVVEKSMSSTVQTRSVVVFGLYDFWVKGFFDYLFFVDGNVEKS